MNYKVKTMGKLYNLVKKSLEELNSYRQTEQDNFLESKLFPNVYKAFLNEKPINVLAGIINNDAAKYFGSRDNFKAFLRGNANLLNEESPYEVPVPAKFEHVYKPLAQYEEFFNNLENNLGEEKVNDIIKEYENRINSKVETVNHPLKPDIDLIKNDVDKLINDPKLAEQYKADLDYLNDCLVEKKSTRNEIDHLIDDANVSREYQAEKQMELFAIENNLDPVKFKNLNTRVGGGLEILPSSEEAIKMTKPLAKIQVTDEYKQKILALDAKIQELGVPSEFAVGEQGIKEYGLVDFFKKGKELSALIGNYEKKTTDEEKLEQINQIVLKKKELAEIEEKYDQLYAFIKENFDLEKVNIPGNVYCGRKYPFVPQNKASFHPNLIPKWDNEMAPYGSILNGFCQLKGTCIDDNVTLEEYMDNSIGIHLNEAKKVADTIDNRLYLPRSEENTLGKRIAHAVLMKDFEYKPVQNQQYKCRALEFLAVVSDQDENTIKNAYAANIGNNYVELLNHAPDMMFLNRDRSVSYDSIKNMFALGDETDKLFETSDNYYNSQIKKGPFPDYKDTVTNVNGRRGPKAELNRVMTSLKDYFAERNHMIENQFEIFGDTSPEEFVKAPSIFIGAKKYFDDYVNLNKKDILNLPKKDRKEIQDFMNDPVKAFFKKYKRELDYTTQDVNEFRDEYRRENDKINKTKGLEFISTFDRHNNAPRGYNVGKDINTILKDNNGGILEWLKRSTSKEYKALRAAVKASTDRNSPTFGETKNLKMYAQKYLDYKLPEGVNEANLNSTEKRRIEFCRSVIATCNEIDKEQEVENINNNIIQNNIENNEFQNQLNNDLNIQNNMIDENIIDTNSNNIIKDDNDLEP